METHRPLHHHSGWTLVELAVALSLTALAAGLAWPSLDQLYAKLALRAAATTMSGALRTARLSAMTEGRAYTARFDAAANRCVVTAEGAPPRIVPLDRRLRFGGADGVLGPPSRPVNALPAGGVSFGGARVIFRADGTLAPGPGTIYLTLRRGAWAPTTAISLNMAGHLRRYWWEGGRWIAG